MKSFMLALALMAGISAHASTADSYSIPLTGAQSEDNFTMSAVQTKTEYRKETVANTCWRTVVDGYQTVCYPGGPQVICRPDGFCTTGPIAGPQCSQEIRYRQEAYTCYQTVSTPYEVFSNNVKANVSVKVTNVPTGAQAPTKDCSLDFSLFGNSFNPVAHCSDFIVLAKQTYASEVQGDTVTQNRALDITLLDAKVVSAPTRNGITEMKFSGQTVSFKTGDLTKNPNFSLKLFVQRRKLLQSDETLINRALTSSEYTFEKTSDGAGIVKINLGKLIDGINAKRKHVIKVDLNVLTSTQGSLNAQLPALSATESITVNE
jgi:hypothetical protein